MFVSTVDDHEAKDTFYGSARVVHKVPRGDKLIIMGDFNARIENKVEMWKRLILKHGKDVENDS